MNRRSFLLRSAAGAGALALPRLKAASAQAPAPAALPDAFVGVQIQPHSFYDEGPERVLDLLQETAAVNALLIYSHTFSSWGGNVPLEVLAPDHGVALRDPATRRFRKLWVRHSPDAFKGLGLRPPAEDAGAEYLDRDPFSELRETCRRRGIKLLARILAPTGAAADALLVGNGSVMTQTLEGAPGRTPCLNHPDYRAFWTAIVADLFRQYPLDGFMFGLEFTGPLYRLIGYGDKPTCFCPHCQGRMRAVGLEPARLRAGYREMHTWVTGMRATRRRPADGALVMFFRLLMRHPEMLRWERESQLALEELVGGLRTTIKGLRPDAYVGRHIDHQQTTTDLFYRAAIGYDEMARTVDFIKPVAYHDVAAPRVQGIFINGFGSSLWADFSAPQVLDLYYAVFGLDPTKEPRLESMRDGGFSPDYVLRETKRCVDGVAGAAHVLPGIGFDIPKHASGGKLVPHPSDPENVFGAAQAAFAAGAQGIVICREYQEMRLPNLRAVGRAARGRAGGGARSL